MNNNINYYNKYLKYKIKYNALRNTLVKQVGGEQKMCKIDELMSNPNYIDECKNNNVVTGSCGDPAFKSNALTSITDTQRDEYIHIFDGIIHKNSISDELNNIQYLDIILGATTNKVSDFKKEDTTLKLFISPNDTFSDSFIICKNILDNPLRNQTLYFNSFFPLNHISPNNLLVLNKILEINNKYNIKVRITNRMCGTCHRSLYYLVKNGIDYKVNPEQDLDKKDDTEPIRYCFKNFTDIIRLKKHTVKMDDNNVYDIYPSYVKYDL